MTKGNQDDDFVFLQKDEVSQLKDEALNAIRFGNNDLDRQFKRDIEFISLAIVQCGQSVQDKMKADSLLKSMLLLFFGQVCYRHIEDQRFYAFDTLSDTIKKNSTLACFPIAALLLHGSRVLIEFPSEIASQLMDWFITDKSSWRYLATHGISALAEAEVINNHPKNTSMARPVHKRLKEDKVSGAYAAINLLSNSITSLMSNAYFSASTLAYVQDKLDSAEHYGIDLALGGVNNRHFFSKKIIRNDGKNGHLYINFYQGFAQKKHAGLLLGIEQSAPGKPDQYGGKHDLSVSHKAYSASGGDFFCKKPSVLAIYQEDYRGLTVLPFANYYDSLWNFITEETFTLIKANFKQCKYLLSVLRKEGSLLFIKHLLSSSGGANQKDFDRLFNDYFQAHSHVKEAVNAEKATKQKCAIELKYLREKKIKPKKSNKHLLVNRAHYFMQAVTSQMGWSADKSQKRKILLGLQETTQINEMNTEQLIFLLKNFIGVCLMNRYYFKGETHTAKACLTCLSLPYYQSLAALLKMGSKVQYRNLLDLVSDGKKRKKYFTSARYKRNLYRFYQEAEARKNQLADTTFSIATQQIIYTP